MKVEQEICETSATVPQQANTILIDTRHAIVQYFINVILIATHFALKPKVLREFHKHILFKRFPRANWQSAQIIILHYANSGTVRRRRREK